MHRMRMPFDRQMRACESSRSSRTPGPWAAVLAWLNPAIESAGLGPPIGGGIGVSYPPGKPETPPEARTQKVALRRTAGRLALSPTSPAQDGPTNLAGLFGDKQPRRAASDGVAWDSARRSRSGGSLRHETCRLGTHVDSQTSS